MSMSRPRRRLTTEESAQLRQQMQDYLIDRAIDHLVAIDVDQPDDFDYDGSIIEYAMEHGMTTTTHELRIAGLLPVALQV